MTTAEREGMFEIIDAAVMAAEAYDRPDLAERLGETADRIREAEVQVVIVGEFKQGKSSFINALLNTRICPVDDDIATAVPTLVRHGEEPKAWLMLGEDDDDMALEATPISFDDVTTYATESGTKLPTEGAVRGVEIELPRKLLSEGLVLVDTPGVGGLGSAHSTAALGALSLADAVIFASDCSQEFTEAELNFLMQALDLSPRVLCVATKTDLYPAWREVQELNEMHFEEAGLDVPILAVSASLRAEAAKRNDRELNEESGFPPVLQWLAEDVVAEVLDATLDAAGDEVQDTCEQMASTLANERSALDDPSNANELVVSLRAAAKAAEQLRSKASRWNLTLSDGITDLSADVDFDFKNRIRRLTAEADKAIDEGDPLDTWAEFQPWLVNRVSSEIVENYHVLSDKTDALSELVADHFDEEGAAVLDLLELHNPITAIRGVRVGDSMEIRRPTFGARGMTMLKNSYTGILMFTVLGSMVGVALAPVAVGIGLLMGRKGLKDEKERQLTQRRSQAKVALRQYCDEILFKVSKDSRDTLRQVHRELRDHFSERAEDIQRSTASALVAATDADRHDAEERAARLADVDAELARIEQLANAVDALLGVREVEVE